MTTQELKTLAHDLRSPLAALKLTTSELALEQAHSQLIEQCLSSLESMVSKLGEMGLPGSLGLAPLPSAPAQILKDLTPRFRRLAQKKKLELNTWIAPHTLSLLSPIEAIAFERAIVNLINNAIEASQPEATISLAIRAHQDQLMICLRDHGQGIPSELLDKVQRPGFTAGKPGGQGLGLSQAKQAIEAAGGSFELHSEEGQGTLVFIHLPVLRPSLHQGYKTSLSLCA